VCFPSGARLEQAVLREKDEGALRMPASPWRPLRLGDLLQGSAEVDGAGTRAPGRRPRDRPVERIVDLEGCRPMAEAAQTAHVVAR
jgi:hypothetical protein